MDDLEKYETLEVTMAPDSGVQLCHLTQEQIQEELEKVLLKVQKPSVFFEVLRQMDQLDHWFPELKALIGVKQPPSYHAEGDAWTHTMMVLDQAAAFRHRTADPYGFMLSALAHDLGKAVCDRDENGVVNAYGHEALGLPLAEAFLRRITQDKKHIGYVWNMVAYHMMPHVAARAGSSVEVTNQMFRQSVDPEGLVCLALADDRGCVSQEESIDPEPFLRERLRIFRETTKTETDK